MHNGQHFDYQIEIVRPSDGRRFGRRQVPDSHLEPVREQLLFAAQRRGKAPADLTGIEACDVPQFEDDQSGEIASLTFNLGQGTDRVEQRHGLDLFQPVASAISAELVQSKQLEANEEIICRTYARPAASHLSTNGVKASVKRQPLPLLSGQIDDFLALAKAVGTLHHDDYPVFVLDEVLERAHDLSWKGRSLEGGSWLIGGLYQQTTPKPEIFAVIHSVLEARGATHERFRIEMSTETFLDLQAQMQRRKRFAQTPETEIGAYHTHPFLPSILDGKEACPTCPLQKECNLTSSFFSQTDAQFHKALFGRAPYTVEMVLGLTPREEFDLRMFVMDGSGFRQRGYYRLTSLPT